MKSKAKSKLEKIKFLTKMSSEFVKYVEEKLNQTQIDPEIKQLMQLFIIDLQDKNWQLQALKNDVNNLKATLERKEQNYLPGQRQQKAGHFVVSKLIKLKKRKQFHLYFDISFLYSQYCSDHYHRLVRNYSVGSVS